jgi:circadian clock protein KaiB
MKKPARGSATNPSPARKRRSGPAEPTALRRARSRRAKYVLRLYISRSTSKSQLAVANIKRVCAEHLNGRYDLEVIDITEHANLARDEQIVAVPTLIKRLPLPLQCLVGDMSNLSQVLFGLDLKMQEP